MPQEQGIAEISTLLRQTQGGAYFSNAMLCEPTQLKKSTSIFLTSGSILKLYNEFDNGII
jgi:hypothetical protein